MNRALRKKNMMCHIIETNYCNSWKKWRSQDSSYTFANFQWYLTSFYIKKTCWPHGWKEREQRIIVTMMKWAYFGHTPNMPVNDEHFSYTNIFVGMEFLLAMPFCLKN